MSTPGPRTLRCPACGASFPAWAPPLGATSWTRCPVCGAAVPVVGARHEPPLFSWEVYPNLYASPTRGAILGARADRFTVVGLVAAAIVLAILASVLLGAGVLSLVGGRTTLTGTVLGTSGSGISGPVGGATVTVSGENGFVALVQTNAAGQFRVPNVPTGAVTVNVSAPGYSPTSMQIFLGPAYSAPELGSGGLQVTLIPGPATVTTVIVSSPFSTLESFVASVWVGGGGVLIAAVLAFAGARAVYRRPPRFALAVAGGVAAALTPFALFLVAVPDAFPAISSVDAAVAIVGLMAAGLATARLASTSPPLGPERMDRIDLPTAGNSGSPTPSPGEGRESTETAPAGERPE